MDNTEIALTAICDSSIGTNKLSHFKVDLPFPIHFAEPYSLCVADITYPNLLCNINNDENFLSISLYKKSNKPKYTQISRTVEGEICILKFYINIHIKTAYYPSIEDLCERVRKYIEEKYDHIEMFHDDNLLLNLTSISVPKIDLEPFYREKCFWFRDSLKALHFTSYESVPLKLSKYIIDINKHMTDNTSELLWGESELWGIQGWNLWHTLNLPTSNFIVENIGEKLSPNDFSHINLDNRIQLLQLLYDRIRHKFKTLAENAGNDIRVYLKLSVEFYLFGVFIIDMCKDNIEGEHNTLMQPSFDEKLKNVYTYLEGEESSDKALELMYEVIINLTCLKNLTDLSPTSQGRIRKGVERRIELFFKDLKTTIKYIQEKYHSIGSPKDKLTYMTSLNREFCYIDPEYIPPSSPQDFIATFNHEIKHIFKRMIYNGNRFAIIPVEGYKKNKKIKNKFETDYMEIAFIGEELSPFFGHAGRSITVKKSQQFTASIVPAIKLKNTHFFLYCSQIREQFVNNIMTPLLACVPIPPESKWGSPIHITFSNPVFLNLNSTYMNSLEFDIKNGFGESVVFEDTSQTIVILLVLRPTKKGVT